MSLCSPRAPVCLILTIKNERRQSSSQSFWCNPMMPPYQIKLGLVDIRIDFAPSEILRHQPIKWDARRGPRGLAPTESRQKRWGAVQQSLPKLLAFLQMHDSFALASYLRQIRLWVKDFGVSCSLELQGLRENNLPLLSKIARSFSTLKGIAP